MGKISDELSDLLIQGNSDEALAYIQKLDKNKENAYEIYDAIKDYQSPEVFRELVVGDFEGLLDKKEIQELNQIFTQTVCLEDIVDGFDRIGDIEELYLNRLTGEIQSRLMGGIEEEEEELIPYEFCVPFPSQQELNEYGIMLEFAQNCNINTIKEKLLDALRLRKPYRHFKDEINYLGIAEDYYQFKEERMKEKAIDFLELNNIPYIRKRKI